MRFYDACTIIIGEDIELVFDVANDDRVVNFARPPASNSHQSARLGSLVDRIINDRRVDDLRFTENIDDAIR